MRACAPASTLPALILPSSPSTRLCVATLLLILLLPFRANADGGPAWVTPHDSYSSSVGVLGCKINTNRVAYWPGNVDCNNICIELTYESRSIKLLRIDTSEGAYDVSYDAWNYLTTGKSSTDLPTAGGAMPMQYENLDASECASLIHTDGHKLPLSASNSMNYLASCLAQPDSWVARNYILYNILDPLCTWGYDEKCKLDWPTQNQAACPHVLGTPNILTTAPVYNIRYPTGEVVLASSGQSAPAGLGLPSEGNGIRPPVSAWGLFMLLAMIYSLLRPI